VLWHATSGRAKTSGVDIRRMRTNGATLLHIRDGKVTRLVIYPYMPTAPSPTSASPQRPTRLVTVKGFSSWTYRDPHKDSLFLVNRMVTFISDARAAQLSSGTGAKAAPARLRGG
jgi:hypothetical protein